MSTPVATSWWSYFTNNNITGLQQAIRSGQVSPNAMDVYNNSILSNATARGQLNMALMLVANGAKIPNSDSCEWVGKQATGVSPSDIAIMQKLVCHGQIDPTVQNTYNSYLPPTNMKKYLLISGGILSVIVVAGLIYYMSKKSK